MCALRSAQVSFVCEAHDAHLSVFWNDFVQHESDDGKCILHAQAVALITDVELGDGLYLNEYHFLVAVCHEDLFCVVGEQLSELDLALDRGQQLFVHFSGRILESIGDFLDDLFEFLIFLLGLAHVEREKESEMKNDPFLTLLPI